MTGGTRRTRRGALGLIIGATASYGMAPTELFAQSASPALLDASLIDTEGSAEHTLNDVAVRQGFFEQAGIRSDVAYILGTDGLIGALTRGTADLCLASGISPVIAAIADGAPLRIVAGANLLNVHTVFSKFENIRTLRDLEGKRVGVGPKGALLHQLVAAGMMKQGLDPSKVTFVDLANSGSVFKAVAKGDVDAGPGEIDVYEHMDKYGVHALEGGLLWRELPDYTNQGSYASLDAIHNRREQIVRALMVRARLYRFLHSSDSREPFANSRALALGRFEPEETRTQWDFYQSRKPFAADLILSDERIRYLQEINVRMGLQKGMLSTDAILDNSLAAEAIARLKS